MVWYDPTSWLDTDAEADAKESGDMLFGTGRFQTTQISQDPGTSYSRSSVQGDEAHDKTLDYRTEGGFDRRNYMYGRSPTAADDAVSKANQVGDLGIAYGQQGANAGNTAGQMGNFLLGQRTADAGMYQGRTSPQGDFGAQNATLGQLGGLEATQGPSAAQAQLQAGTNQAMGSQIALARSGRGFGGNAAAAGLAQGNMAGIQANQANAAATLRAQEDAAWRGRQAQNMGAVAGMQGQQAQTNLGAQLTSRGQNDAAALQSIGFGQQALNQGQAMQQQGYQTALGGVGTSLNGQTLGHNIRGQQMGGGLAQEDNVLRQMAAVNGYDLAQAQMQNQKDAATMSAGATIAGAALVASDIRAKKNIRPADGAGADFARGLDFDGTLYRPRQMGGYDPKPDDARLDKASQGELQALADRDPERFDSWADKRGWSGPTESRITPMQAQYMGGPVSQEQYDQLRPTERLESREPPNQSTFPPGARPDNTKPFDTDTLDASAADAVRNSPASFYDYKDPSKPGAAPGRQYGPMAQDLLKTPAGASAVVKQPDGSLGVDTGRLTLVQNGAINEQQKQLDALMAEFDKFRSSPSAVQPDQVYGGRR